VVSSRIAARSSSRTKRKTGYVSSTASVREYEGGSSHYDRAFGPLVQHYIEMGKLLPGGTILETTSGNAGVSCARVARLLGLRCIIAIPKGIENAREKAIENEGARVIPVPGDYVNAFPKFALDFLVKNRDVVYLNHSMGPNKTENRIVTNAMAQIGVELIDELDRIDAFVVAFGNGSSVLGPGRDLKRHNPNMQLIGFESAQSGDAYDKRYPGRYKDMLGIDLGSLPRHKLYGTSYPGINFPHTRIAFAEGLVDHVVLVSDRWVDADYRRIIKKEMPRDLPRWDSISYPPYGRSTRAGIVVALHVAPQLLESSNIVLLAYDREDRYDPE